MQGKGGDKKGKLDTVSSTFKKPNILPALQMPHAFNKCLLSTHYVPGTVLGAGILDNEQNQTVSYCPILIGYCSLGETNINQMIPQINTQLQLW